MLEAGDQIDIWVVEKSLGSGGMGSVYRCHNRNASRILAAVKVLDSSLRKYPEAEARFIREAEILFQLDHPNIVKVRNVRTDADPPYLEMEFIEGESLDDRLRRGALPYEVAVHQMQQIASAIAYLHKKGVRHRDIKPANLLVDKDGQIKLVDFGLAMEADTTRITQQGMTFGTVSYAPPEWIAPDTLDPSRWDIYAIGVVYLEMLTGTPAFPVSGQGSARQQAMQVIVGKQGHPPLDPGDAFHDDIRQLIREMTHSDPEQRIGSAAEVVRRTRALVLSLRHNSGVTLAPAGIGDWDDDLDKTPDAPPQARSSDTWHSHGGAPDRDVAPPPSDPQAAPAAPAPTTSAWTTGRLVGSSLLLGGFAFVAMAALLLTIFWISGGLGGGTRDVQIAVTGVAADATVGIRLDEREPDSADGLVFHFGEVEVGQHEVTWVLGDRCPTERCPSEDCPAWCGTGSTPYQISAGNEPQVVTVALAPPIPRRVKITTSKLTRPWEVDFDLGTVKGRSVTDGIVFQEIPPGNHTLTARVGRCDATALGCWPDGSCPAGCASYRAKLVVPWGDGEFTWDLAIEDPAPVTTAASRPSAPVAVPEPQAPSPAPAPAGVGAAVTVGELAQWLGTHPEWHREAALAESRAKGNYLAGWDGATPPSGRSRSAAAVDVSWYAASAYCRNRGGLAAIDAEPLRWEESERSPYLELRTSAGKAAWRAADGRESKHAVSASEVQALTGFRCAR